MRIYPNFLKVFLAEGIKAPLTGSALSAAAVSEEGPGHGQRGSGLRPEESLSAFSRVRQALPSFLFSTNLDIGITHNFWLKNADTFPLPHSIPKQAWQHSFHFRMSIKYCTCVSHGIIASVYMKLNKWCLKPKASINFSSGKHWSISDMEWKNLDHQLNSQLHTH